MTEPSIKRRKIVEKVTIYIRNDQDDVDDDESNNNVNIEHIKEDLQKVIDYNRNTTLYHSDGSIVISPRYLENLPDKILDKILGYFCDQQQFQYTILQNRLYQLCFVNKQFYQCANRILWRSPYIYNTATLDRFLTCWANTQMEQQSTHPPSGNDRHCRILPNMLTAKHHLRELEITGEFWDDRQVSIIMPYMGLLETLVINSHPQISNITDTFLHDLPQYCPNITTLSLDRTIVMGPSCLDVLDAVTRHCHQLRQLELYLGIYKQHYEDIAKSLARCRSLAILHLYGGYGYYGHSMIRNIAQLHPLTDLALIGTSWTTVRMFMNVIDPRSTWPRLSSLCIDNGQCLTDAFMIPFIQSHRHLQSLDLGSTQLSDTTLDTITTGLVRITNVRIVNNDKITPNGVYHLIRYCQDLQHADFSNCGNLVKSMIEFSELGSNEPAILTLAQMTKIRRQNNNN